MRKICAWALLVLVLVLGGCATQKPPYDYTEFKNSRPKSVLVLPPLNDSVDVGATYSIYSSVSRPLGEAGYYVFPVTLVDELFKGHGFTTPNDIHAIAPEKLHDIFQADTALYLIVKDYGTRYQVISSVAVVTLEAKLVDLRSGATLWTGRATASSDEGKNNNQGLAAALISAIVNQIASNIADQSHTIGKTATTRLLSGGHKDGILYGPRHPSYLNDK